MITASVDRINVQMSVDGKAEEVETEMALLMMAMYTTLRKEEGKAAADHWLARVNELMEHIGDVPVIQIEEMDDE